MDAVYAEKITEDTYMIGLPCLGVRLLTSSYVLVGKKVILFETGITKSADFLLAGLDQLGLARSDIDYLIVSHIHLDHAGATGYLAQQFSRARVMVHEKGAQHLIDPSRLVASTKKVFGENVIRDEYGEVVPIPDERVIPLADGDVIDLGNGRLLEVFHTPGHAAHHLCLFDRSNRSLLAGEALGLYFADLATLTPSTSMPDFDLDANIASIFRLIDLAPRRIYFSHFGYTDDVQRTFYTVIGQLLAWGEVVRTSPPEETKERLTAYVLEKEWAAWGTSLSGRRARSPGPAELDAVAHWCGLRAGIS